MNLILDLVFKKQVARRISHPFSGKRASSSSRTRAPHASHRDACHRPDARGTEQMAWLWV